MEYNPKCLRKVANWSYLTKHHKFDKKTFDPENIKENLKTYSPKTQSLIEKIKELDEDDYKTHGKYFKHFIFSEVKDGGYGVRVITAALIAEGFKLGYDNKVNVLDDSELLKNKNDNILLLSSTKVFNTTINVKRKKAILAKYNQRPENSHGKLARIILLDSGFKEGIDLFDVKYVHIFEPQTSKADQKQAIGRATRLCGQKGIEFHPKYGWPLEVFLYDTTIPSDLMKYYDNDDSLFKFFLKYSGIDLRQIDFVDELEKYSIVGAVDYELTANVHRFALEEEETDISWLFPSKKGGLARKYITDEISCQKKCSARPTKDVPIGLPLFISIYFVYGKKLPDLRKESPRKFLCKVLKEDEDFCALARKAWKDPARFIKKNKAVFAEAIKEKKHLNLPRGTRPSFIKFVNSFGSIYSPSTASTVASHSVVSSKSSSKALSASSKSSSSNSSSPVESSPSVISTASPKSISSTSIPLPETSKNIVESYESPKKIMNFIDMRKYIRENYIQYKWPKVKMENLCVPKGGSELVKFTPTQDFIRHFFTPESAYKGMLLFHSVGSGKTCSAIATATTSFEKENYTILWVTRTTLKSDVYKNMFDQVCHTILQQKLDKIPEKSSERLRLLSASWKIKPMSYKQFSNLVSGKNKLHKELIKINGEKDPLKNTLLIIDEAHKLYGGTDLSSKEKPDMEKLHESVMNSYKVSGKNSVRLLLMTATPITNDPMELIKILNLCRQKDDQLPIEYDKFADKFKVDEDGKFSKKGSREYLDAIAGYISYLSRERDARQFSQPIITRVDSEISTPTLNTKKIAEIETKYDGQIEDFKDQIFEINEELKQFKKETMAKKKEAKEDCKQYKKEEKKECLEKAKDLIEQYNDELSDKKDQVTDDVKNLKAEIKSLKKDKKEELKVYTEDKSQETAVQTKCIKKPPKEKKSKNQNSTSKSQSPPVSGKSDTQPVVYSP